MLSDARLYGVTRHGRWRLLRRWYYIAIAERLFITPPRK